MEGSVIQRSMIIDCWCWRDLRKLRSSEVNVTCCKVRQQSSQTHTVLYKCQMGGRDIQCVRAWGERLLGLGRSGKISWGDEN